jgi:YlmC/YmxH family sporulation protein
VVKTSELRLKEVVNLRDGRRLGTITDLELDLTSGRVLALILPASSRWLGFFGRDHDVVIPWSQIRKFGQDTILVEIEEEAPA